MLDSLIKLFSQRPVLCLVFVLILIFAALAIGYAVGINRLMRGRRGKDDRSAYVGKIENLIIDHLNLGVIAYNADSAVYCNNTIRDLPGFLGEDKKIPRDINSFLTRYEQDNHLKSNYILNSENDDTVIRANYTVGRKIYEIKILHRVVDGDRLDIVIVDDITQIKDDERRQKDLAANVSHELKTPLTVIRASELFVNSIRPDKMPEYDEIIKWGNRIVANAVRMQDIVQDFLILSMTSSNVPMNIIDIREAAVKAVGSISDYPNRDKVSINLPDEGCYPLVFGNANLVMRVIINMLTNAVKYIDYEGKTAPHEINIEIVEIDDRVAVSVSDNGRGIPGKDIDHLFERFYRVDNSGSRDVGGSGIGLSIAKDVANMHDGTITVVSELGSGSTFTLSLPKAQTVFTNVFEDASTGIVSENQYYRTAADFMAVQVTEAVRSMGYSDVLEAADEMEKTSPGEKTAHDRRLATLLTKLGKERYDELVEELTFVEDDGFDDEFDDEQDTDDVSFDEDIDDIGAAAEDGEITEIPAETAAGEPETESEEKSGEAQFQPSQPSVRAVPEISSELMTSLESEPESPEEEEIRKQKEEARKLLTTPILPRAVPDRKISPETPETAKKDSNVKETVRIHPNKEKKLYNGISRKSGKKKSTLFEEIKETPAAPEEPEIRSAVRKVLDETSPIVPADQKEEEQSE